MIEHRYFLSIAFSICALIFITHIFIMYISKKKFKNVENSIFKYLLIGNVITILLEFSYTYCLSIMDKIPTFTTFICRLYHSAISLWMILFIFYMLVLMTREIDEPAKKKSIRNRIMIILTSAYIILQIVLLFLPIEFYDYSESLYVFGGMSSYYIVFLGVMAILTMVIGIVSSKSINKKQKLPLYLCLVIISVLLFLQYAILQIEFNLENFLYAILLMTLYFTLENQDNMILEELGESKKVAEIANKAQTDFLTNMSHEIRTPMNSILGFTETLLGEENLTEDIVKRDMENIHDAAMSLLSLINNILDISRMESGRETIIEKNYDLKDLMYEINSLMQAKVPKEIEFEINVDEKIPKTYKGDYTKISKIVSNILLNARNYTSFGKIGIEVTTEEDEKKGNLLKFLISNSGHTMKEEDFNRDFADFVNIRTAQNNTVSSVSLGLMVAKQYAEMMQGKIDFLNETGKGTRYYISIPQEIINNEAVGNIFENVAKDRPDYKLFDLTGKRLLVVDDNKVNIKLATRLLEGYKATIDTAESGRECIEKVKDNQYDIIFLDHMMPEMDGIATLKLLKSYGYKLPPIIALTANTYSGVREQYIEQGFSDYLAKPISYKELNKIMFEYFMKEDRGERNKPTPEVIPEKKEEIL